MTESTTPIKRVWWEPGLRGCRKGCVSTWNQGIVIHERIFWHWHRVYAYVACTTTGAPVAYVDPNETDGKPILATC